MGINYYEQQQCQKVAFGIKVANIVDCASYTLCEPYT